MVVDRLLDRLASGFAEERFGYLYRAGSSAEAAALGAIALRAHGRDADAPLDWLQSQQKEDGGIPVLPSLDQPRWPTSLALWALATAGRESAAERAAEYLLAHRGIPFERSELMGHDTTLIGWSWVDETHSWVEPTGYALVGLREAGRAEHARCRSGVAVLLDRCLPDGGWNYGNTRVMSNMLRPFPATTGVALLGLAGEPMVQAIARSLDYLRASVGSLKAPVSLGWSLLALAAWGREAPAMELIEATVRAPGRRPPDPVHDALLAIAASRFEAEPETGSVVEVE